MKNIIILIVLITVVFPVADAGAQDMPIATYMQPSAVETVEEETFKEVGIFLLSLHPLNLWQEEPDPMFDVLAAGLHMEGSHFTMLLGYASMPSHPDYAQEIYYGVGYMFIREEKSRISVGLLSEFNFDENFELPSDPTSPIYQMGATLGIGFSILNNVWFYMDMYVIKLDFEMSGIQAKLFFEQSTPILPRIVIKF